MLLTEILHPECIKVPLLSRDKRGAIDELVDLLAEKGYVTEATKLKEAVWQRESTRTTGIGHGLAIPHGKSECCGKLLMAIGKPAEPIEFQSIDKKPVSAIFLLVSPQDQTGPHIQVLARISRLMTRADIRATIMRATDAQTIYDVIAREEKVGV